MKSSQHEFEVELMCSMFEVSRSGYYNWLRREPSARSKRDADLKAQITRFHTQSDGTYGSPRIHDDLKEAGERVSRKRVSRIMRENQLFSAHKKKFRVTTDSEHQFPVAENVMARDFEANTQNQKWVTDVTYISTREGWLYLAVVLDLFSRRVVGWSMSKSLEKQLVLDALRMALNDRRPGESLLHHSDRGSQYASNEYREMLDANVILASMSRRGNCWDNAVAESFFKTLKVERVRRRTYRTRDEAQRDIFQYIAVFYNRKRKHSTLGYKTPVDFEALHMAALH